MQPFIKLASNRDNDNFADCVAPVSQLPQSGGIPVTTSSDNCTSSVGSIPSGTSPVRPVTSPSGLNTQASNFPTGTWGNSGQARGIRTVASRGTCYALGRMSSTASGPYPLLGGEEEDIHSDLRKEYDAMEKWLDEHPEFVHDYFARKARKSMIDGWLIAHALSGADNLSTSSAGSNSKASSGANTPVRKISAQEFDKGGLLNPMISTVDGLPTFLGPSTSSTPTQSKYRRRSKSELKALDEKELMYELVIDICNDLDVTSLCYKILQNLCILLNADRCSLFLVHGKGTHEKYLASKLFDVSCDSTFDNACDPKDEIRISWGTGIIGCVAKTGEVLNIPDAYQVSNNNFFK